MISISKLFHVIETSRQIPSVDIISFSIIDDLFKEVLEFIENPNLQTSVICHNKCLRMYTKMNRKKIDYVFLNRFYL